MKGHLMAAVALLAWTVAAVAADGGVVAYEAGKVYGPISILGNEAVTVDGHGAIIDGGGKARCATLGPNVTLRNFTFQNGRAAVGGGILGGKVTDCTIKNCTATEYGAAVANCEASWTTITGCERPLDTSVKAAMHGGIAADSTLTGVKITGCRVKMGTSVPCFGGIAANSSLAHCEVSGNTVDGADDHYGLLFYGESLEYSAIVGNSVKSSLGNTAAYMKVELRDCTLDGDEPQPGGGSYVIRFKVPQGLGKPADMTCGTGKVYKLPSLPDGYKWRRLDVNGRIYDGGLLVFNLTDRALLEMEAVRVP